MEPTLVVMAAGMGSRFGGLKQMTPVDAEGHFIIDFSLFDAYRAGFRKVVFIIKREMEKDFREAIGKRAGKLLEVQYVYQELTDLPDGFSVPQERVKPWGTGHAVLAARHAVDGPFAVINSDDFYGRTAYQVAYDYLANSDNGREFAMVGYHVGRTVTENGSVARGICTEKDGLLVSVREQLNIYKDGENAKYTDDGVNFTKLPGDTVVSMNFWCFTSAMMQGLQEAFPTFLREGVPQNPMKAEFFLPMVVNQMLDDGRAQVRVLRCAESWFGVTYHEDLDGVKAAIENMKNEGVYPRSLWA
ncbi:MAG: nucleotidyltransferase [Clostridia bacterium]|nr:nucleotidyltransferase [Clostridia bacterium]